MPTANRRPSIYQIGQVTDDGTTITISGWGLGLCQSRCRCHSGVDRLLRIDDNPHNGDLGLVKHHGPCDCCQPWTADELAAIVRDLATVAALETA